MDSKSSNPMRQQIMANIFDQKVIGGILLILGTCLGGAILALPISNAHTGFGISSIYLFVVWLVMTFCSMLILEVNLLFKPGTNLLTMSKQTLGTVGQVITCFVYFVLLYNLLWFYISSGSGIMVQVWNIVGVHLTDNLGALVFIAMFGVIVFCTINRLDQINRAFIIIKLALFVMIVFLGAKAIHLDGVISSSGYYSNGIIMVLSTSFGYGVVIPSLRVYLDNDPFKLRLAVIVGSCIPLVIYILWDFMLMGTIGTEMLMRLSTDGQPTKTMINIFSAIVQNKFAVNMFHIFAAICIVTSFFGISLSMSDFLYDALSFKKEGKQRLIVFLLTFGPPMLLMFWLQKGFLVALEYAGVCCVVLHVILPILMAWSRLQSFGWSCKYNKMFKITSVALLAISSTAIIINLMSVI